MIKKAILIVMTGILVITSGCSGSTGKEDRKEVTSSLTSNMEEEQSQESTIQSETSDQDVATAPSLGGISLGDTSEDVIAALGDQYSETVESDVSGAFGEDIAVWKYDNGMTVSIGKTSGKVLWIASTGPDFQTDLGIKVGDDAKTVFDTYRPKFEEAVSRHSNETLEGWFLMEEGTIMVFDFDKSDDTLINGDITPDSKAEEIILTHWKYFD